MTSRATSRDTCVVHGCTSKRGSQFMASLTSRTCWYVVGWFAYNCFSHRKGSTAGMASSTACGNACMVHRRASKAGGRFMASLTRRSGWYMVSWFGQASTTSNVAGRASRSNTCVVHRCTTLKAGGRFMAGFTCRCRGNVATWFA